MSDDNVPTTIRSHPVLLVGQVLRSDAFSADSTTAGHSRTIPHLRDSWCDRTVVQRGIVVRHVGGTLPEWSEPTAESNLASILDLVVLHDAASSAAQGNWRVPATACLFRVVIGEERSLAADGIWRRLPRADVAVSVAATDLDTVARCFVDVFGGAGLIGIDTRDTLDAVGCLGSRPARGRAMVIPGQGVTAGLAVREALTAMEREEEVTSILLCQSISPADSTLRDLFELDAMATAAMSGGDRTLVLAGVIDRPQTEIVVIAFGREGNTCLIQ